MLRRFIYLVGILSAVTCNAEPAFAQRGYYMTFMRMPAFGLAEWKQIVDCIEEDGGNTLLLWTAGGFRSKQFPETWALPPTAQKQRKKPLLRSTAILKPARWIC
jgi:hypothetical protein